MTKDEALKLALEALENMSTALREDDVLGRDIELMLNAITAIKEALAQPEQEPWCMKMNGCKTKCEDCPDKPPEERNFCQRCGKRTADLTTIHTCTPPQIDPNKWAFDNGLEST